MCTCYVTQHVQFVQVDVRPWGPMRANAHANARSRRTRDALLTATRELLEEHGFEKLTMAAVAERAGVSRRAVYLHFPSRSALVAELFDFVTQSEDLAASTDPVWNAPDALTALDRWAHHVAGFQPRLLALTRAVEHVHRSDPDAAAHRRRYLREQLDACRKLARRLDDEHALAAPWTVATASEMLWALISTDLLERLLHERRWSRAKLADHLALLMRSTLVSQEAGTARGSADQPAKLQS
jgi:AcrR family transcriptional regulator